MPTQSERPPVVVNRSCPALIVLSAKAGDRLREQASQLVAALERRSLGDADLADVAYTLQVGREAMESRVALTAGSLAELTSKLKGYLSGKRGIDGLYSGEAKREKDTLAAFAADEDMAQILDAWVAKGKYGKLLELWVKGLSFDWRRLYGDARPRRISLPTYPFARERYWMEQPDKHSQNGVSESLKLNGFDALAYEKLFDGLMTNTVSINDATNEITKLLS